MGAMYGIFALGTYLAIHQGIFLYTSTLTCLLCLIGILVLHGGLFPKDVIIPGWLCCCDMAKFGTELTWHRIRLPSLCEVTWTRCWAYQSGVLWITLQRQQLQPLLQQLCHHLVCVTPRQDARSKNIYSSHLSIQLCLTSLSLPLLFLFASFHKQRNVSQFPNNWILHRNILRQLLS